MRRVRIAVLFCLAAAGCNTSPLSNDVSGPVASCESFNYASCQRLSECTTDVNVDNCAQQLNAAINCQQASCTGGTFSQEGAQMCLDAYLNQDCADSINSVPPAICTAVPSVICIVQ